MNADPETFAFRPREKTRDGFIRVVGGVASAATACGKSSRLPVADALHAERVFIKRLRALLWFARPALPRAVDEEVRETLRMAARSLAGHRDLAVTRTTLEKIGRKTGKPVKRRAVARATRCLGEIAGEREEKAIWSRVRYAATLLRQTAAKIIANTGGQANWPPSAARLKKAVHATHKARKKAQRTQDDADFHAWRKKTKRLLYLTELTAAGASGIPSQGLDKLQTCLGKDHDCVMAERRLKAAPLDHSDRTHVSKLLHHRESRLRKKARKLADRMGL